nr:delta-5 fatty acyl desaturase [Pomacea canaliculata]
MLCVLCQTAAHIKLLLSSRPSWRHSKTSFLSTVLCWCSIKCSSHACVTIVSTCFYYRLRLVGFNTTLAIYLFLKNPNGTTSSTILLSDFSR